MTIRENAFVFHTVPAVYPGQFTGHDDRVAAACRDGSATRTRVHRIIAARSSSPPKAYADFRACCLLVSLWIHRNAFTTHTHTPARARKRRSVNWRRDGFRAAINPEPDTSFRARIRNTVCIKRSHALFPSVVDDRRFVRPGVRPAISPRTINAIKYTINVFTSARNFIIIIIIVFPPSLPVRMAIEEESKSYLFRKRRTRG